MSFPRRRDRLAVGAVLIRSVSYAWRLLVTGLAFAALGAGGLLLSVTPIPAARLFASGRDAKIARAQVIIHRSFQLYLFMLRALGVIRLETVGAEKLRT